MACIYGKSKCETCGKEFEWRKHDSQKPARFCSRKCTNKDFGILGNKERIFWSIATEEQKRERLKMFFESKVVRKEGCWDWKGSLDKNGYPQLYFGNTKAKGHRVSYEIYNGIIPDGLCVCHSCDNPKCTNPEHLWLGTKQENTEDEVKKGRQSKGEDRYNSKLNNEKVKKIREMISLGVTVSHLSRIYNVSFMCVQNIKNGKTWKHVE